MFVVNNYNLQVLRLCVEKDSFTEVADALSISQPAVSRHIRDMEKYFGIPLFEKRGKRVRLTDAGRSVYDYAVNQLSSLDNLMMELTQIQKGIRGQVIIGASFTIGRYRLPEILASFLKENPQTNIRLVTDDHDSIITRVHEGKVDFACVISEGTYAGIIVEPLYFEPQILVTSPNHPLVKEEVVDIHQLNSYPLISSLEESHYMRELKQRLVNAGIKHINIAIQLGDTEGIKRGIQSGLGIGFMYRSAIESDLRLGILKEVKVRNLTFFDRVDLVYLRNRYFSPLVRRVIAEIKTNLQDTT